jgi:hypothetical protein
MTATPTKPRRGAPLKDPEAGRRVSITLRVHPRTAATLKRAAGAWKQSQGEIVDMTVEGGLPMFR